MGASGSNNKDTDGERVPSFTECVNVPKPPGFAPFDMCDLTDDRAVELLQQSLIRNSRAHTFMIHVRNLDAFLASTAFEFDRVRIPETSSLMTVCAFELGEGWNHIGDGIDSKGEPFNVRCAVLLRGDDDRITQDWFNLDVGAFPKPGTDPRCPVVSHEIVESVFLPLVNWLVNHLVWLGDGADVYVARLNAIEVYARAASVVGDRAPDARVFFPRDNELIFTNKFKQHARLLLWVNHPDRSVAVRNSLMRRGVDLGDADRADRVDAVRRALQARNHSTDRAEECFRAAEAEFERLSNRSSLEETPPTREQWEVFARAFVEAGDDNYDRGGYAWNVMRTWGLVQE